MKILIVGGNGTIGSEVTRFFRKDHLVVVAGRKNGDVTANIADSDSIKEMFHTVGKLDAIICVAGEAKWASLNELTEEDYYIGIRSKMMGQVNLVRLGREFLNPGGSFTLTTGILAEDPVYKTASAAMVNGAIHSFVLAAALEMTNSHRINVVAAGLVEASADKYAAYFPGHNPVPMGKVVNAYARSVLGRGNGEIIRVYG